MAVKEDSKNSRFVKKTHHSMNVHKILPVGKMYQLTANYVFSNVNNIEAGRVEGGRLSSKEYYHRSSDPSLAVKAAYS